MTNQYTRGCHHSGWDDNRIELLKKLYVDGRSASFIAARISATGFHVTRNAVIGKAHRLGLAGTAPRARPTRTKSRRTAKNREPKQRPWEMDFKRKSAKIFAEEPFVPGPELVVPEVERKTLLQLDEDDCRWPIGHVGEVGFHFCNGKKAPGLPYCEHHCRRAFQPPEARRKPIYASLAFTYDQMRGVTVLESGEAAINTGDKVEA